MKSGHNGQRVKQVICAPGRSGYMHRDLMAIKSGATQDGGLYRGQAMSPGFTKIVEPGTIISVMLVLEDGQIAFGDCADVILAGVAVSSLATALISRALSLSRHPFAAGEIVYWLLGSLADRSLTHVWLAAPFMIAGIWLMLRLGAGLDALSLGEDAAENLGIDLVRLRQTAIAGAALAVGAATAVAGSIGFVGLVVPHLLRPYVGHQPSRLLPACLVGGAVLVLVADIALRLLTPSGELRLGVVTALIGTPLFLWLVHQTRRELAP